MPSVAAFELFVASTTKEASSCDKNQLAKGHSGSGAVRDVHVCERLQPAECLSERRKLQLAGIFMLRDLLYRNEIQKEISYHG
jgi:hypothetical protein